MAYSLDPALRRLKDLISKADSQGLPRSFISDLQGIEDLIKARDEYCVSKTSRPSREMAALIKETQEHPWQRVANEGKMGWAISPIFMSGNLEGYVIKFLVSISKAKRALDIGMFTGCSALGMAEVMPSDGKVFACEIEPYLAALGRKFMDKSPHGKKVEILLGPALETLNDLARKREKFDFIFIDADKEGYPDYFNICLNHLLARGGTIAIDNALFLGQPYMSGTPNQGVTRCNNMITSRDDIYYVLMPIRDGIMLVRRKEDMGGS